MKLYATTKSERASKGQGGDYLDIAITDEHKNELWRISVIWGIDSEMNNNHLMTITEDGKDIFKAGKSTTGYGEIGSKGNKKKDECAYCRKNTASLKNDYGKKICEDCD